MKNRHHLKKYALPLLLAAVFALCPCLDARAEGAVSGDKAAEAVPLRIACTDERLDCNDVNDGDEATYVTTNRETVFTITSEERFENLYLKFEMPCEWTLTFHDGAKTYGGEDGYIHEYIPLGRSVKSVELTLPKLAKLTDVYAFTDGQLPWWVQVWEPPCEKADLLVMVAHADDEHLWFGGALPYYAGELGYEVQVVYMTNHNNATLRNHERLNGLWTVGVTHYPVVSEYFVDLPETRPSLEAAAAIFGYDYAVAFHVENLRRFAPRVVLGHDINGEYGHGAHKLSAKALLEALELTNDPTVYPDTADTYGTCQVQKCYLHLWPQNQITVNWSEIRLQRFDNRTSLEVARFGFNCHKSQQIPYRVEESGPYDCRLFGLAYTTVGRDTEGRNDMFEHVEWPNKVSDDIWEDVPDELKPGAGDTPSSARTKRTARQTISPDMQRLLLVGGALILVTALSAVCIAFVRRRSSKGVND